MKVSMVSVACLMGSAIASPVVSKDNTAVVARTNEILARDVANEIVARGLLDGLLGGLLGGTTGSSSSSTSLSSLIDPSTLSTLDPLTSLVSTVTSLVSSVLSLLSGVGSGSTGTSTLTSLVPQLTTQLTSIQTALSGLSGVTSGITSGSALSLADQAGSAVLLARLFASVGQLLTSLNTVTGGDTSTAGLGNVLSLVSGITGTLGSGVDLSSLLPGL